MKDNIEMFINDICDKQDYDKILINIVKPGKNNKINCILETINADKTIEKKKKTEIYEKILDYATELNNELEVQVKKIFEDGVRAGIKELNEQERKCEIMEKIRIVIADDNKGQCDLYQKFFNGYEDVEILGIANTDEEEIEMIETLKPEIVITDLMRPKGWTGLDIIKDYFNKKTGPEFLVISADEKSDVIRDGLEVAGYLKKPFVDYELIYNELKRIKKEMKNKKTNLEYKEWEKRYWNDKVIDIMALLSKKDIKIIKKLGIKVKNKIYTMQEFNTLEYELYMYYFEDDEFEEEEKNYKKSLKGTGVDEKEYKELMLKISEIERTH